MSDLKLPKNAPKPRVRGEARRKFAVVVAIAVPVILLVVAIPSFINFARPADGPVAPISQAGTGPARVKPTAIDTDEDPADGDTDSAGDAAIQPAEDIESVDVSATGDIGICLELEFTSRLEGLPIRAQLRIANHGERGLHVPAADEAQPTLEIVVLDAQGAEVRRVVESGDDALPRRTFLLESGRVTRIPVALVEDEDEALPPGEYSAHVEYAAHPHWARLGLDMWTAPHGSLRSDRVRFEVTAR